MDPWRPKYKPVYDAIEYAAQIAKLAVMMAAFMTIVILSL